MKGKKKEKEVGKKNGWKEKKSMLLGHFYLLCACFIEFRLIVAHVL